MEKVFNLNLALEEAVVNVMNYAYPDQSGMPITVTAQRDDTGSITFQITDEGTPFDPTIQEDPDITLSAEERQIGGLGIFLVKELMTSVHYTRHDNKNILTLTM